jgi:hypothetical protein
MYRLVPILTIGFIVGAIIVNAASFGAQPNPAGAGERVLRHIVLYKFKDDLRPEQVQEVVEAFAGLPKKIATIVGFEAGTNVSGEGKSQGLTHAFVVSFRSEKDRDAYLVHPAHLEYVNLVRERREKVIVFDYWASE